MLFLSVISLLLVVILHWMTTFVSYLILVTASLLSIGKETKRLRNYYLWVGRPGLQFSSVDLGFTGFLWWTYVDIMHTMDKTENYMQLEEVAKNERAFLAYSILSTIFTVLDNESQDMVVNSCAASSSPVYSFQVILLLVVLYVRTRVTIVVKLFRETGSAMMAMKCLLLQPVITYAALVIFFCMWLYIVLCLATSGKIIF
jgi:hypothetical protein